MKAITTGEWRRDGEAIQVSWDKIGYGEIQIGDEVEFDSVTCKVVDTGSRFKVGAYAYGYLYVEKVAGQATLASTAKGDNRFRQQSEQTYDDLVDRHGEDGAFAMWPHGAAENGRAL